MSSYTGSRAALRRGGNTKDGWDATTISSPSISAAMGDRQKPKNFSDYAISHFADDIQELCTHLRIKEPVLVSHSFGTVIALEFLREHKRTARAAVFLAPIGDIKKMGGAAAVDYLATTSVELLDLFPFRPRSAGRLIIQNISTLATGTCGA